MIDQASPGGDIDHNLLIQPVGEIHSIDDLMDINNLKSLASTIFGKSSNVSIYNPQSISTHDFCGLYLLKIID